MRYCFTHTRMVLTKQAITVVGQDVQKSKPLCTLCWWKCNDADTVKNILVVPQKVKHRITA